MSEPTTGAGRALLRDLTDLDVTRAAPTGDYLGPTGVHRAIVAIEREAAALAGSGPEAHVHEHYEPGMTWDDKRGGYVHAGSGPEAGLREAWDRVVATLPMAGWTDPLDGRWVIPTGTYSIDIRRAESGDGYFEPAVDGYWATAKVESSLRPFAIRGDLGTTPEAALDSLATAILAATPTASPAGSGPEAGLDLATLELAVLDASHHEFPSVRKASIRRVFAETRAALAATPTASPTAPDDRFLAVASEEMRRRFDHGAAKFGRYSWREDPYTDPDNEARLRRAVDHLIAAVAAEAGEDETRKRAADVANQAFMYADPERYRVDESRLAATPTASPTDRCANCGDAAHPETPHYFDRAASPTATGERETR